MANKVMTEQQKEEFQLFFGFKSRLGIIWILQALFALLALIGFLCPLFSYNETKIDELKETVGLSDVPIAIVGLLFLVIAIILTMCILIIIQKAIIEGTQEKLGKKLIGFTVGIGVSLFLSIIIVAVAYLLYEVPTTHYTELDFDAGFYLFTIGATVFFLLNFMFTWGTRNLLSGKTSREQVLLGQKKSPEKTPSEERTIDEKLTELKRLRDAGLLKEEEYETKKQELLDNLK